MAESCRQVTALLPPVPGHTQQDQINQDYVTKSESLERLADSVADPIRDPVRMLSHVFNLMGTSTGNLSKEEMNQELKELGAQDQILSMCGYR